MRKQRVYELHRIACIYSNIKPQSLKAFRCYVVVFFLCVLRYFLFHFRALSLTYVSFRWALRVRLKRALQGGIVFLMYIFLVR